MRLSRSFRRSVTRQVRVRVYDERKSKRLVYRLMTPTIRALLLGAVLLGLPLSARAQPYGLTSRPVVGPFLNGAVPESAPTLSGNWSAVVAFPNLTFLNAVGLTHLPGTAKLVVWEREGRIYHFDNLTNVASKTLMLNITNQVQGWDDSGLLGVAFHPGFVTNRFMFCWYTWVTPGTVQGNQNQRPPTSTPNRMRLARFTLDANNIVVPGSETVFIDQNAQTVWHEGGGLFFGDDDFLYLTIGDDSVGSNNQIITRSLFSGVIRIDVDRRGGSISHAIPKQPLNGVTANYFIPNDNPFVGVTDALEEFFAIGLRSPHRMTFDPVSRRIFIGDVGAGSREEISIIEPGERGLNFQWDRIEGLNGDLTQPYIGVNKRPVIDYSHSEGFAVIGGYVYRGQQFAADLGGKYLFGDNGSKRVWVLDESTTPATKILLATVPPGPGPNPGNDYVGLSSFGLDANGEIYMCQMSSTGGRIYKLQRGGPTNAPLPRLLSQTGAFTNTAMLAASGALIPYDVNSPLWSDGAVKSRWMVIPTNYSINYSPTGEWTFPNGSVFVKHFELPINDTNPAIRKRLETRLLVRDTNGAVYGATYKWRADNTDADLLDSSTVENVSITTAPVGSFSGTDLGGPALAGSTTPFSGGYQIVAGGTDIWNQNDQGHFAHQQRTGDFDVQTRVESLTRADLYTKAGLMARESLAAGSRHVFALVFPSNEARNNNTGGYEFQSRATTGGGSVAIYPAAPQPAVNYPNTWLRFKRSGDTFTAYSSADGLTWREFASTTLDLPDTIYFGFAVTAHTAGTTTTARFHLSNRRLQQWYYPSRNDCLACHTTAARGVLGLKTRQSNRDFHFPQTGVTDNQLRAWGHVGLFDAPPADPDLALLTKLVSVTNATAPLETRVRSYLDANCAHCHRPGGVQAFWDGRFDTPLFGQGLINGQVANTLGITGAKVVVPANLLKSILHRRVLSTDAAIKMPPLARNVVDEPAVAAITEWISTLPPNFGSTTLVSAGANWKYFDTGTNLGTAWTAPAFDDSAWASGPAQLGFGDGGEATVVNGGPANGRYITTYFRHTFAVTNIGSYTNMTVSVLRDDGAVVHVNGVEVFRSNMPGGAVDYLTPASGTALDADESTTFYPMDFSPSLLVEGTNVIAVEIHQANNTSSDISFDLELNGYRNPSTNNLPPSVVIAAPLNNAIFSAPASVSVLITAADGEGSVTNVELYTNNMRIGTDASAPFAFAWNGVLAGAYQLVAVATDNTGLSATSAVVNVSVTANNLPPLVALTSPSSNAVSTARALITFTATASDADGTVSRVEFYQGLTKLGEVVAPPYSFAWNNVGTGSYALSAVAVDNHGATAASAVVPVSVVTAPQLFTNSLVATGAVWKYLDNNSDLGTAWRAPLFDDSAWASAPAKLGSNDNAVTVINIGPPNARFVTTYFRRGFHVTGATEYTNLAFRVLRDDGVVVWLNNTEVFRMNMPGGVITNTTLASAAVSGAGESTYFATNRPATSLVEGFNVLAIELHQSTLDSSDAGFDLELIGRGARTSDLPVVLSGESISPGVFRLWFNAAPGRRYVIEASTDLQSWVPVHTNSAPGGLFEYLDTTPDLWRFYRARTAP